MTLQSEQINEIAAAMVAVQNEMRPAFKGADNPYFKSKYADLAEVWKACHEALTNNGIAVIQGSRLVDGFPCMETKLVHTSGQWLSSLWQMTPVKSDPQAMGSAITYLRRYSLAAMVGVVTSDDDGEAAMGRDPATMERNRVRADDNAARQVGKYLDKNKLPDDIPRNEQEWKDYAKSLILTIREAKGTGTLDMIETTASDILEHCQSEALKQKIADEIQGRREILTTPAGEHEQTILSGG